MLCTGHHWTSPLQRSAFHIFLDGPHTCEGSQNWRVPLGAVTSALNAVAGALDLFLGVVGRGVALVVGGAHNVVRLVRGLRGCLLCLAALALHLHSPGQPLTPGTR